MVAIAILVGTVMVAIAILVIVIRVLIGDGGDLNAKVKDDLRPAGAGPCRELLFKVGSVCFVHLVVIFNV